MFDIGWGEFLIIGIVALIAIGPKELPSVLRTLGQWMAKLRRMASEFQNQFHEVMREAEMADLKKQVDEVTSQAKSYANFDPVGEVRHELESTQRQIESAFADKPTTEASPAVPAADGASAATVTSAGNGPATAPATDVDAAAPLPAPAEPPSGASALGAQDLGVKDLGVKDLGVKDLGVKDLGAPDAGGKPA
jgi:sec-independent protein translocase protein TatB